MRVHRGINIDTMDDDPSCSSLPSDNNSISKRGYNQVALASSQGQDDMIEIELNSSPNLHTNNQSNV